MKQRLLFVARITLALAAIALVALPAAAFDPVIEHGSDIWTTPANNASVVKFEADPIPADFFCTGSAPFNGRVAVQGVPIATTPEGVLGQTDTIVQRLDNAVFDAEGVATTRLQVSAIQLTSIQPFATACGAYNVHVTLAEGAQPIGEMKIVRQGPGFGYYSAKVALNVEIAFEPVDGDGPTLEIIRHVDFPANRNFWTASPGEGGVSFNNFVQVDTDANGQVDTFIPGTSRNFAPGWFGGERRDVLRREVNVANGPQIGGELKALPNEGPIPVTLDLDIRNLSGALTETTISLEEPVDCTSDECHCEDDGDHCQQVVLATK